jgi:hypothetical protein
MIAVMVERNGIKFNSMNNEIAGMDDGCFERLFKHHDWSSL